MNSVSMLTLCIILALASLGLVSVINRIQTRSRVVRQKSQSVRRRIRELEELCAAVEPLIESVIVPRMINEEVIQLIQTVIKLDSGAKYLDAHLEQAQVLAREFSQDHRTQPLYRLMASDSAIAKAKFYITEAARVIRRHHSLDIIQAAELEANIKELNWAHLMVGVISHVGHGHKAVSRQDYVVAYSYYRKAQNMLINGQQDEQRRHQYIRELSELLSNKRGALSTELMPESEFNPTQNALQLPKEQDFEGDVSTDNKGNTAAQG